jgi:hypothetical protein
MNGLNDGKRPIAFAQENADARIVEPLHEGKKMKHSVLNEWRLSG